MRRLIVFDLDGTLAKSKSSLDAETATLLHDLLGRVRVAIISGGAWSQFEAQVLSKLVHDERLARLSLLPMCGAQFRSYGGHWKELYSENLPTEIVASLKAATREAGFEPERVWGQVIEDRGNRVGAARLGVPEALPPRDALPSADTNARSC